MRSQWQAGPFLAWEGLALEGEDMAFGVDVVHPAVVAIDLHRGHLDPSVATMPLLPGSEHRIIEANRLFLEQCRTAHIPIIHMVTTYRDVAEIRSNPFWRTRADDASSARKNAERHNLEGSPGCEIIPELYESARDWVVNSKKRYDCFVATDLEFILGKHGINTLLLTGVNTNSCVLATAASACSRDYAVIVVADCVDTMDGPDLHRAALLCIQTAFGWVMPSQEVFRSLRGQT